MFPEMDSAFNRPPANVLEKYIISPPQAIISTMDPHNEQKTQKLEESSTTRRQQQQFDNPASPDYSLQQRKTAGSSRKKIQDFINTHKSRAAQSSRRAKSSRRNSNDLTPSEKTAAEKTTDEKHSPGSSSSSKKRLLILFKKSSLRGGSDERKQSPSSKSSKRNRACRQQISMEKPISIHPMPAYLEDEKPLQQMGVSHVVVKTKLDHKQLESAMRKRNQKYRFWSIVVSLITAAILIILMSINVVGIYKVSEIYVLYGKEVAAKSWVDIKDWKMVPETCLNLNEKSIMSRKGRLREEISTCERNWVPIASLPWTEWSVCKNNKMFRYRNIKNNQESIASRFLDFAEFQPC